MRTTRRRRYYESDVLEVGERVAVALLIEECEAQIAYWTPILRGKK